MKNFAAKVKEIREQARNKMEKGAITPSYGANAEKVVEILNEALATEIVCVLRYQFHYYAARGMNSPAVADEFKEHAVSEQQHAELIAKRISELGGKPDFSPTGLAERSDTDYIEGQNLREMLKEDLVAERIVIGIYQEFIRYLGNGDPTTRKLVEKILADEEKHADELSNILFRTEHVDSVEATKKATMKIREEAGLAQHMH